MRTPPLHLPRVPCGACSPSPRARRRYDRSHSAAYYLRAMNPADDTTLIQLAKELGLNATLFSQTLSSPATQARLLQQVSFARRLPIAGFPSLVLTQGAQNHAIPLDYHNAAPSLAAIAQYL